MKFSDHQIEVLMDAIWQKRTDNDRYHREEHGKRLHPTGPHGLATCPGTGSKFCPRSEQHNLLTSIWIKLSNELDARRT